MRKFLCVLALGIVASTGWFFWPRISSELDARFPEIMEKRSELNQPSLDEAPETGAPGEAESAAEPRAEPNEPKTDGSEAPAEAPESAASESPEASKTSLSIDRSEKVWF
jgi:hypothetical protein